MTDTTTEGVTTEATAETTASASNPAPASNPVLNTIEDVVETVTRTTTPQASAGVLIGWIVSVLEGALGLGGQAATADAVKEHVEQLKTHKDALADAVAANP